MPFPRTKRLVLGVPKLQQQPIVQTDKIVPFQVTTLIIVHKRQRMIAPVFSLPSVIQVNDANSDPTARRARWVGAPPLSEPQAGWLPRQGSVNEIRLQIPTHLNDAPRTTGRGLFARSFLHPVTRPGPGRRETRILNPLGSHQTPASSSQTSLILGACGSCFPLLRRSVHRRERFGASSRGSLNAIREYHRHRKITRSHAKVMAIISAILVVFTVGWCPYMIALFLHAVCPNHCNLGPAVLNGLLTLCILQSFSNFFVYFVKDSSFKHRVKELCSLGKNLGFKNRVGVGVGMERSRVGEQGMFGATEPPRVTPSEPNGAIKSVPTVSQRVHAE